jgi:hypothetical protein
MPAYPVKSRRIRLNLLGTESGVASIKEFEAFNVNYTWSTADDTDDHVTCSGGVKFVKDTGFVNNTIKYQDQEGDRIQYDFWGKGVKWIGAKGTAYGKAEVYIDGILDTLIDAYSRNLQLKQVLYTKTGLNDSIHSIRIVATGMKNKESKGYRVDCDAFDFLPSDIFGEDMDVIHLYEAKEKAAASQMTGNDVIGGKFHADKLFSAIDVSCSSRDNNTGSLTMKLYRWDTDYQTTVLRTPLFEKQFNNFEDNTYLKLDFPMLQPGDYLWTLDEAKKTVGVWIYAESNTDYTAYWNGSVIPGNYVSRIYKREVKPIISLPYSMDDLRKKNKYE